MEPFVETAKLALLKTCPTCKLEWIPRPSNGAVDLACCPQCCALMLTSKLESLRADAEWGSALALKLALDAAPGGHALAFSVDLPKQAGTTFLVSADPYMTFRPELLLVAPECANGMLIDFKIGNATQFINAVPTSLSVFSPAAWASPELMARARLKCDVMCVGQRATLSVQMHPSTTEPLVATARAALGMPTGEPEKFQALLWGRTADHYETAPQPDSLAELLDKTSPAYKRALEWVQTTRGFVDLVRECADHIRVGHKYEVSLPPRRTQKFP